MTETKNRWMITSAGSPGIIYREFRLPAGQIIDWVPQNPKDLPRGGQYPSEEAKFQWWLDDGNGNGFRPVGDPFTYGETFNFTDLFAPTPEKAK